MPETRFTEFPALSVDPRGWDFSVSIGDRCLIIFLTYDIKKYYLSFVISFDFDILHLITTFPNAIRCFSWKCKCDVTSEIQRSDVTFNVACELSSPMGKTESSTTAKHRTKSVSQVRKEDLETRC